MIPLPEQDGVDKKSLHDISWTTGLNSKKKFTELSPIMPSTNSASPNKMALEL